MYIMYYIKCIFYINVYYIQLSSTRMQVVVGVEKRYNEEQANLLGNDEINETCISDKSTDKIALVLAIVLPTLLLLLLLGGFFAPQISAFFKKTSKFKK